ncbi:MAG: hypothetical protein US60_C0015G0004 [Microgenomates group bacterium GW2011_GWC1_37_8]|uniref:Uncharacterized protein n=1 Tax=Candidatus Woesebacteria bacterium GW2011_GWB1_38_8 TaxID=1618570 RepID=A0A0G0P9P2_9BACT|nr:MAG: hypothetical protein US60_C0015G0004 [Microgenomates group bacterium GW2011_GWC1_37_8]KKQ86046.1 MAG: hypothetical protein UT08_C0002G0068 [Candidatus Woesebacteria bacterium GW2011_GWB1_38_8]
MKGKIDSFKYPKNIWFLSLFLVLLVGAIVLTFKPNRNKTNILESTPTPTVKVYPVDTKNDGAYINYEYGFKFEYPEETFVYYSPITQSGRVIGATFRDNDEGAPGKINLTVNINGRGNDSIYFREYKKIPIGKFETDKEYTPLHESTKIKDINIEGVEGFVLYNQLINNETDAYQGHSLSLLKENNVITIYVSTLAGPDLSDPQKEERLRIQNGIINTFEFFTLTPTP